jgi:hypothetical protein
LNGNTLLDGFTFTSGNAKGTDANNRGGGMYISVVYTVDNQSVFANCKEYIQPDRRTAVM